MRRITTALLICLALSACATAPQKPLAMGADTRTGTDFSPYRSIAPAIQCDDCRY